MILCCPDKFRGSLTAEEAAAAMCRGVARAGPDARALPLADGGEGTLDALLGSLAGRRLTATVTGPDGRPVEAEWAVLGTGLQSWRWRERAASRSSSATTHYRDDVRHGRVDRAALDQAAAASSSASEVRQRSTAGLARSTRCPGRSAAPRCSLRAT